MPRNRLQRYRKALREMTVGADCPLAGTVVIPANVPPREAARLALAALRPIVAAKIARESGQSRAR